MQFQRIVSLIIFNIICTASLVCCTEFVPVYMWDNTKTTDQVPALHKISQDSFKEILVEHLKDDPYVVVFAEQTLSPEDFAQRDQSGDVAFPKLSTLKESSKVSYRPYVQNPIKAFRHLDKDVVEISIESLRKTLHVPEADVLIVDLNDAQDNEHRIDMLKRHDSDIISIYKEIAKKHDNVLALYTAHHTSWVAPEEIANDRKIRSLLAKADGDDTKAHPVNDFHDVYFYASDVIVDDKSTNTTFSSVKSGDNIIGTLKLPSVDLVFNFTSTASKYWLMESAELNNTKIGTNSIYAPFRYSYHCTNQTFATTSMTVKLVDFQIQPIYKNLSNNATTKFDDAYDCTGFTSVPIWSGIFVTFILLLIMTFGLTMMVDIKTMDRFDDAKGKTITINVSE